MNHPPMILAAALGALLLSPAAHAGSISSATTATTNQAPVTAETTARKCSALQAQWQNDATAQKGHPDFAKAQKMANSGMKLCTAGRLEDGIERLKAALKEIGLKPAV